MKIMHGLTGCRARLEYGESEGSRIHLEKSVGSRFIAQGIDSTAFIKNIHLTEWVRLRFFQSTVKPIACAINPRPTGLYRINDHHLALVEKQATKRWEPQMNTNKQRYESAALIKELFYSSSFAFVSIRGSVFWEV